MLLSDMGNWADDRLDEGCRVRSVASLEMAAGLSALSAMDILAREPVSPSGVDHSHHLTRFILRRSDHGQLRSRAILSGIAVSRPRPSEIMFRGFAASCYPRCSMGAEGVVTITSRRPN